MSKKLFGHIKLPESQQEMEGWRLGRADGVGYDADIDKTRLWRLLAEYVSARMKDDSDAEKAARDAVYEMIDRAAEDAFLDGVHTALTTADVVVTLGEGQRRAWLSCWVSDWGVVAPDGKGESPYAMISTDVETTGGMESFCGQTITSMESAEFDSFVSHMEAPYRERRKIRSDGSSDCS